MLFKIILVFLLAIVAVAMLGSTVVMLFPQGPLQFNPAWQPGGAIRMGQAMARCA